MLLKLAKILAPPQCAGCEREGEILCIQCQQIVVKATIKNNQDITVVTEFNEVGRKLIHAYKFQRQRNASHIIAKLITQSLPNQSFSMVTSTPTAPVRVRRRGFDHAALLARRVAADLKLPHRPLLFRRSSARQVGQHRETRFRQAENLYGAHPAARGHHILLIDDVITTGATIEACTKALKNAMAASVWAAVLASRPAPPGKEQGTKYRQPNKEHPEEEV